MPITCTHLVFLLYVNCVGIYVSTTCVSGLNNTDLAGLKLDLCASFHHTAIYKGLNSICQITYTLEYYLFIFVFEAFIFTENGVCAHQFGVYTMVNKRI